MVTCPFSSTCTRTPWNSYTCHNAAYYKHWDCLQYAVDNKCPEWELFAKKFANYLR